MLGIHGTSVSICEIIRSSGFNLSEAGRSGPGIYFWRYFRSENYAKYLAYKWWEYCRKKGDYNSLGSNTNCCLITVETDIPDEKILDLSHGALREDIRELINSQLARIRGKTINREAEEVLISGLYHTYIKAIEQKTGTTFDAIISDVSTPKGTPGPIGKYFGNCGEALIVLNSTNLKVVRHEKVADYEY